MKKEIIMLNGKATYALVALYLVSMGYSLVTGDQAFDPATAQEAILVSMVAAGRRALASLQTALAA